MTIKEVSELFDITFCVQGDKPKVTIVLKSKYKKETKAVGKNNMPISTSSVDYFMHHLGDEQLSKEAYDFYRQFFNKRFACSYAEKIGLITNEDKTKIAEYFESVATRTKTNHLQVVKSVEYRNKLSASCNRELQSAIKKKMYSDPAYKEKVYKATQSETAKQKRASKFKEWFTDNRDEWLIACNKPERLEQISKSAKDMWNRFKATNDEKIYNIIRSSWSKNYELNGTKYNRPEYLAAKELVKHNQVFLYDQAIVREKAVWYRPDFLLPDKMIIIECYGDYWHGNPKHYLMEDKLFSNISAGDIWAKDLERKTNLENLGCKVHVLWEEEILNSSILEQRIREIISSENKQQIH